MKAVILAGGKGTRLSEETLIKPKPMVEIGGKPILWHIMKLYSFYGINEFIICCGYKGLQIKQYFANYWINENDITCHIGQKKIEVHSTKTESWKVTLIDTGESTETGGRLKRIAKYLHDEDVCMTYGDGLSNIFEIMYLLDASKTDSDSNDVLDSDEDFDFDSLSNIQ